MNPFAAMAVKFVSGGATAALMTLGVTASLADASVTPTPAPATRHVTSGSRIKAVCSSRPTSVAARGSRSIERSRRWLAARP